MNKFGITSYNANSLKANKLIGPHFNFRNRSVIESYLASNYYVLIQEARLDDFSKEILKLKYNVVTSSAGSSLGGGLLIFAPFKLDQVFEILDEGHLLALVTALPSGERVIIANLYGNPTSSKAKKNEFVSSIDEKLQQLTERHPLAMLYVVYLWTQILR